MRLLCLYAEDLPRLTRTCLSFLRFCQKPEIKIIDGDELDECIEEIIVYKSNRNARVYDSIFADCKQIGLAELNSKNKPKVQLVEVGEDDPKNYSSIHIVCNTLSYANGRSKLVPLEIQIRTLFEDAWGEIDHSLEYKLEVSAGRNLPKRLEPVRDAYRKQLRRLKGHLEDAGNVAQEIRGGYEYISDALQTSKKKNSVFSLKRIFRGYAYGRELNVAQLGDNVEVDMLTQVHNASSDLRDRIHKTINNTSELRSLVRDIDAQVEAIKGCLAAADGEDSFIAQSDEYENIHYLLKMEEAVCLIWKSQLLRHLDGYSIKDQMHYLNMARTIYVELEADKHYRDDPMLNFRLGCVMFELGEPEIGLFFLEGALDRLDYNSSVGSSQFAWIIPHFVGYVIWKRRAALLALGIRNGNSQINRYDQREIICDAIYYCSIARHVSHILPDEVLGDDRQEVNRILCNNLSSFLWELSDLSATDGDFVSEVNWINGELMAFFENYTPTPVENIFAPILERESEALHPHEHDTLMKVYHMLGDVEKSTLHRDQACAMMAKEGKIRKDGINELYWYAQDRIGRRSRVANVANNLTL